MNQALSSWLESDTRWPKFFYADVDAGKWFAGVGADAILKVQRKSSIHMIEKSLRDFTKLHSFVFCGICFDPDVDHCDEWSEFGAAQFFAPAELREGALLESLDCELFDTFPTPSVTSEWEHLFSKTSNAFAQGCLEKVVLAYRDRIEKKENVWGRMMAAPGSFRFAFSPSPGHIFYGASPELLFRKDGPRIQSDALAGTRPKSLGAEKDLLDDPKERLEHQLVVEFLVDKLAKFCSQVEISETKIKHLKHLIHLHTLVGGRVDSENLAFSHLHPTPALCGLPQDAALEFLREHEGFNRGWYGGTIGIIDKDFESFTVAIRAVLQTVSDAFVYFGAGIVPDSTCESEWAEINSKRSAILSNLGEAS